jgi:hypothetical protein
MTVSPYQTLNQGGAPEDYAFVIKLKNSLALPWLPSLLPLTVPRSRIKETSRGKNDYIYWVFNPASQFPEASGGWIAAAANRSMWYHKRGKLSAEAVEKAHLLGHFIPDYRLHKSTQQYV